MKKSRVHPGETAGTASAEDLSREHAQCAPGTARR